MEEHPLMKSIRADMAESQREREKTWLFDEMPTPEIVGAGGQAWLVKPKKLRKPDHVASVCEWIVEARWAHPFWHSYFIGVAYLRDIPNVRPAFKCFEEATHEIMVYALQADKPRAQGIDGRGMYRISPPNYNGQIASTDQDAIVLCGDAVRDITEYKLSPDTDFRSLWKARFGDHYYRGQ